MGWLIATAERTLTEEVPAAPHQVRNFYVDLDNMKSIHPLIVSVHPISRTETADGYLQTYRITDRISLRLLTLRVSYSARLYVPISGDVIAQARQFPRVRLRSRVTFEHIEGGTLLTEGIRIQAPRPLAAVTTREALKAHTATLAGVRRHFEGA